MVQQSIKLGNLEDNESLVDRLDSTGMLVEIAPKIGPLYASSYPELGLRIADAIVDPRMRDLTRRQAVTKLAQIDFEKARDYVEEIASLDERVKLMSPMSRSLMGLSDGGAKLVSLFEAVPAGKERSKVIEDLLMEATQRSVRVSSGYKEGLSILVEGESELSDRAKEAWGKLGDAAP